MSAKPLLTEGNTCSAVNDILSVAQLSKSEKHVGLFRTGMRQSSGYTQAKPMIQERSPLLQIAYAKDIIDMSTYEQISGFVPMRKCRIISEKDLKKQEFFYEKTANSQSN